jgi:hypothetical protein
MWISKGDYFQFTQKARFEGMGEAADSLIRSMSPYFEGDDGLLCVRCFDYLPLRKDLSAMRYDQCCSCRSQ